MRRLLVEPALLAAAALAAATATVCPSMDVRNLPDNLDKLRNCTVILGSLRLVLLQNVNDSAVYDKYVMPNLVEIVDHLILWDLNHLTTVRTLFPNLRIIRGRRLFRFQYALAIYKMPHLQEIGLTNLQHIGRGKVIIMYSSNLCYVNTINWTQLGASELNFPSWDSAECNNQVCPKNCSGYCWNHSYCQKPNSDYCAHFMDEDSCVTSCPESKFTNYDMMRCMTKKECTSLVAGPWFVFNGTCTVSCPIHYNVDKTEGCVFAGKNYKRFCSDIKDTTVESVYALEQFYGCTHLTNHSVDIHITSNVLIQNELEKNLGNLVSIAGFLKIRNCKGITSLEFFKNLTTINGTALDNQKNAISIYDNENLQKLWDFSKLNITRGSILFYENPLLCNPEIEEVMKYHNFSDFNKHIALNTNGYKSICNQKKMIITYKSKNPKDITMQWQDSDWDNSILGYTVYFMLASENGTLSFESEDTCGSLSWEGLFVSGNEAHLTGLSPYTTYVFYIKTHRTSTNKEQQTPIAQFRTASTQPSEPLDLEAEATSDTSILLKWQPPEHLNGHLTHYNVVVYLEEGYLRSISDRDYCAAPLSFEVKEMPTVSTKNLSDCSCPELTFTEFISNDLQCTRDNKFHSCAQSLFQHDTFFENVKMVSVNETYEEPINKNVKYFKVPASKTSYEFVDLQHFTMYVFYVRACNIDDNNKTECGSSVMISQRTDKKKSADVIYGVKIQVSGKDVIIKWSEPKEFNSVLLTYEIEYKRSDSEHSKSKFDCIPQTKHRLSATTSYKIQELSVGKWSVRVHAVSLAGAGKYSEWKSFEIQSEENLTVNILGPVLALIFVLIIFIGAYAWHRSKRSRDNVHLITSINPDYAGPIYVEDQWEIDRSDIELIKDLGHGTFGKVYQGIIKSRNYPCAVKTVTDEASTTVRMDFLNEGSVMKTFSDAAHVVKLLGIVSRGHPPLVIMELMERGDLKQYLWRCREPSQNLTTNEMYRMAAEIADGMAYLTAKKFVHRDLAARNCMVAGDRTVKIGDFGMTRDIYETDYYRKDTMGLLPVRWMAPESLADGVFTSDSDVWSYGIVLWEMATLAQQPYQGLSNEEVLHFVRSGHRLDRPSECSDLLFEVMDACWMWRPSDRPTFNDIVNKLVDHVGQDFRLVAFCFSQQGRELALNAGPRVKNPPAMALTEDDYFGRFDASEEEVNLYRRDSSRPNSFLPFSNQRNMSMPYQMSPGSPSSTFLFNSS